MGYTFFVEMLAIAGAVSLYLLCSVCWVSAFLSVVVIGFVYIYLGAGIVGLHQVKGRLSAVRYAGIFGKLFLFFLALGLVCYFVSLALGYPY
jgi:hypothetical protein